MPAPPQPAAGFVLTGGSSRRMGSDKALLPLAGKPLALRLIELLEPLVAEVRLVGAPERYRHLGVPTLSDHEPGRGPLGGLVTALRSSSYDWNLVVACDLPYLRSELLALLLERAVRYPSRDAVVPQTPVPGSGEVLRWQPLCAVYHRRSLPAFERLLAGPNPKISLAFPDLNLLPIGPDELARFAFPAHLLKNMNTPEEYAEARQLLGE